MADISNKVLSDIREYLSEIDKQVKKIHGVLADIEAMKAQSYREIPGVEGVFDGVQMISTSGEKFEVPANYAAKSRLVYGDTLKKIEEDGKTLFKQIVKVPRIKVEGILNKKEGKWYILTDGGSYRISDIAAEFNSAQANDQAEAWLPEGDLKAPYAALDKILTQRTVQPKVNLKPKEEVSGIATKQSDKPASAKPRSKKKPAAKAETPKEPKEFVSGIGDQQTPQKSGNQTIASLKDMDDSDLR